MACTLPSVCHGWVVPSIVCFHESSVRDGLTSSWCSSFSFQLMEDWAGLEQAWADANSLATGPYDDNELKLQSEKAHGEIHVYMEPSAVHLWPKYHDISIENMTLIKYRQAQRFPCPCETDLPRPSWSCHLSSCSANQSECAVTRRSWRPSFANCSP